jgi:hypothetical protein
MCTASSNKRWQLNQQPYPWRYKIPTVRPGASARKTSTLRIVAKRTLVDTSVSVLPLFVLSSQLLHSPMHIPTLFPPRYFNGESAQWCHELVQRRGKLS